MQEYSLIIDLLTGECCNPGVGVKLNSNVFLCGADRAPGSEGDQGKGSSAPAAAGG